MNHINKLIIKNFKFFNGETTFNFDGKNILLYGENGSGKSSLYWALYTFFQTYFKNPGDVKKYFASNDDNNLRNRYSLDTETSFIEIVYRDNIPRKIYELGEYNIRGQQDVDILNASKVSDFIDYKVLTKFYALYHKQELDLFDFFRHHFFSFINFRQDIIFAKKSITTSNAGICWENINDPEIPKPKIKYQKELNRRMLLFNDELNFYLNEIASRTNKYLKETFYEEFEISFNFSNCEYFDNKKGRGQTTWEVKPPKIVLVVKSTSAIIPEGKRTIDSPHSFFNEAKLSLLALSMRFAILNQKYFEEPPKVLVLDDFLISLDMCNREKVLDLIFNEFVPKYQTVILTHDRFFFDLVDHYISSRSRSKEWKKFELYSGEDQSTGKHYPVIIEDESDYLKKANKYLVAKDYSACASNLRKQLEKMVLDRLPIEYRKSDKKEFNELNFLWDRCIERYSALKHPIDKTTKNGFSNSRLLFLNPQAHHNISAPVYFEEVKNAFKLVKNIEDNYPIIEAIILLRAGMVLEFRHPTENYTFNFKLTTDLYFDSFKEEFNSEVPRSKIQSWQYNDIEFYDFDNKQKMASDTIKSITGGETKLNKAIENLKKIKELEINDKMFIENTHLTNGVWKLKEILDKAGVTLESGKLKKKVKRWNFIVIIRKLSSASSKIAGSLLSKNKSVL